MLKTGYEESGDFSYNAILGIDECGYGCGAGDLFVCGVVLPKSYSNSELIDSKKIKSRVKMARIANELMINPDVKYTIERVSVSKINARGVVKALRSAVIRVIRTFSLSNACDAVFIDGVERYDGSVPVINVIKGDNTYQNIAAASIICKYTRDTYMIDESKKYSGYDFENNKGYLTPKHIKALKEMGVTEIHREKYVEKIIPQKR